MQIPLIFSLVIVFLLIIFAVQNAVPVPIKFLIWDTQGSLALLLFIALAAGALISYLASTPGQIRRRRLIAIQQKQIAELEGKLLELQPVPEEPEESKVDT